MKPIKFLHNRLNPEQHGIIHEDIALTTAMNQSEILVLSQTPTQYLEESGVSFVPDRRRVLGMVAGVVLGAGATAFVSSEAIASKVTSYTPHSAKYLKKHCPVTVELNTPGKQFEDSAPGIKAKVTPVQVGESILDSGFHSPDYASRYSWHWNSKKLVYCGAIGLRGAGYENKLAGTMIPIKPDNLTSTHGDYTTLVSGNPKEVSYMKIFARKKR